MAQSPLRIGLLGASRIAVKAVTLASRRTGDERAAVAARDLDRAHAYAEEHGYEVAYGSYAELIDDETIDLIYVGLPNGLHAEWAVRALQAGRSVLVEKPFAANLAEFERVADELAHSKGWAWEAFHYADHPLMARLTEIAASGELGELREVRVVMRMPSPAPTDARWNFDLAGGTVMDLGCYALHALVTLSDKLGVPLELLGATAVPYGADPRLDASMAVQLSLGDAVATIDTSMESADLEFSLTLIGERGSLRAPFYVKPQDDDRLIVESAGETREEHMGSTPTFEYQLAKVRSALRSGTRDLAELDRSRRTIALIDGVYEASGLPVRFGRL